ncbi:hypothetical protein BJV77DRAFT_688782 [Russula vinacea]|nr:hypothetical protein BJV77DRAFT_688782 [Russula vinacea]
MKRRVPQSGCLSHSVFLTRRSLTICHSRRANKIRFLKMQRIGRTCTSTSLKDLAGRVTSRLSPPFSPPHSSCPRTNAQPVKELSSTNLSETLHVEGSTAVNANVDAAPPTEVASQRLPNATRRNRCGAVVSSSIHCARARPPGLPTYRELARRQAQGVRPPYQCRLLNDCLALHLIQLRISMRPLHDDDDKRLATAQIGDFSDSHYP